MEFQDVNDSAKITHSTDTLGVVQFSVYFDLSPAETDDENIVKLEKEMEFEPPSLDADNTPSRLYLCVRGQNYLGAWSPLLWQEVTVL